MQARLGRAVMTEGKARHICCVAPLLYFFTKVARDRKRRTMDCQSARIRFAPVKRRRHGGVNGFVARILLHSQNYSCWICRNMLPSDWAVDHWVPLADGGEDHMTNYRVLCSSCHGQKTVWENARRAELQILRAKAQHIADEYSHAHSHAHSHTHSHTHSHAHSHCVATCPHQCSNVV